MKYITVLYSTVHDSTVQYIFKEYGSMFGGPMDAIQLEIPTEVRNGPDETRERFSQTLALIITEFMKLYYQ